MRASTLLVAALVLVAVVAVPAVAVAVLARELGPSCGAHQAPVTLVDRLPGGAAPCCGGKMCPTAGGVCCNGNAHCCPGGTHCLPLRAGEGQKCGVQQFHPDDAKAARHAVVAKQNEQFLKDPPLALHVQLVQARSIKQMTRKQLANAVGVTAGDIMRYELAEDLPDGAVLGRLQQTLGVSLSVVSVANGEEEPETFSPKPQQRPAATAIREGREARGLTRGQLAAAIGVTEAKVSSFENDPNAPPTLADTRRIAAALSVPIPDPRLPPRVAPADLTKLLPTLRNNRGLSVASMAKSIGVAASVVRGLEKAKVRPTSLLRPRIDEVLGTSLDAAATPVQDLTYEVTLAKERVPEGEKAKDEGGKVTGGATRNGNEAVDEMTQEDRQAFTKLAAQKAAERVAEEARARAKGKKEAERGEVPEGTQSKQAQGGAASKQKKADEEQKKEEQKKERQQEEVADIVAEKKSADEKEAAAAQALNNAKAAKDKKDEEDQANKAKKVMEEAAAARKRTAQAEAELKEAQKGQTKSQRDLAAIAADNEAAAKAAEEAAGSAAKAEADKAKADAAKGAAAAARMVKEAAAAAAAAKGQAAAKTAEAKSQAAAAKGKAVELRVRAASQMCVAAAGKAVAGVQVALEVCIKATHKWKLGNDLTLRPSTEISLCLESTRGLLTLAKCNGRAAQKFKRAGLLLKQGSSCVAHRRALVSGEPTQVGSCKGRQAQFDLVGASAARSTPAPKWLILSPGNVAVRRCVESHTRGARLVTCEARNTLLQWRRYPDGSLRPASDASRCLDSAGGANTQPRVVACAARSRTQTWRSERSGQQRALAGLSLALRSTSPKTGDPLRLVKAATKTPPAALFWLPVGADVQKK